MAERGREGGRGECYSLAPSGLFDVAHTIFKPYARCPRARSHTVYTGQVLPMSMRSLGATLITPLLRDMAGIYVPYHSRGCYICTHRIKVHA